ncbi:MAG: hypothetical protein WBQ43_21230 [Terriglobales bacterium]
MDLALALAGEDVVVQFENCCPSAAKAGTEKKGVYRSGKPVRHPKARTKASFSANCDAANENAMLTARLKLYPFKAASNCTTTGEDARLTAAETAALQTQRCPTCGRCASPPSVISCRVSYRRCNH